MTSRPAISWFLALLALVFTVGLTFATVELPYLIDDALQSGIATPGFDSRSNDANVLKAELFISHFRLRLVGYICLAMLIAAIAIGFSTRRTGFAVAGTVGLMLPVFAQFASVMFFLSGLGLLNVVWLPVLDVSWEMHRLGLIVKAPYELLLWLLGLVGINGYWPIVISCIGGGLLIFFLSTLAWLMARARKKDVADFWLYRFSCHPQYLGWILWSYGVFLLLEQQRYPKRSWGLGASLPWMLATLVIIGVAAMEELRMARRFGASYEAYRRRTPFLFPMPAFLARLATLPQRVMFGDAVPKRRREVVAVLAVYTALLTGASAFFYGFGAERITAAVNPARADEEQQEIVRKLDSASDYHAKRRLASDLADYGEAASGRFVQLLQHDDTQIRTLAVSHLEQSESEAAIAGLISALEDPAEDVRARAAAVLGRKAVPEAAVALLPLLDDSVQWVRSAAMHALARLGSEAIIDCASQQVWSEETHERKSAIEALGILGSERGTPLAAEGLNDNSPPVRQAAVIALLQIGAPAAREALRTALDDEDWEVRMYAAEAVKRLGSSASTRRTAG